MIATIEIQRGPKNQCETYRENNYRIKKSAAQRPIIKFNSTKSESSYPHVHHLS